MGPCLLLNNWQFFKLLRKAAAWLAAPWCCRAQAGAVTQPGTARSLVLGHFAVWDENAASHKPVVRQLYLAVGFSVSSTEQDQGLQTLSENRGSCLFHWKKWIWRAVFALQEQVTELRNAETVVKKDHLKWKVFNIFNGKWTSRIVAVARILFQRWMQN